MHLVAARMFPYAINSIFGCPIPRPMATRRFPTISMYHREIAVHREREADVLKVAKEETGIANGTGVNGLVTESVKSAGDVEDNLLWNWELFCKNQSLPPAVRMNMEKIKDLEIEFGEELKFGGPRGSMKGRPGAEEDQRHREFYDSLSDSEQKLQNFSARQVACRLIGSKGYLCDTCWLPERDCMCECYDTMKLWSGICFWVYTHPKDFLRKNNTGKLLWQVFGKSTAQLTVYGIPEQEEVMWTAFKNAGRERVWCIYPYPPEKMVSDITFPRESLLRHGKRSEDTHCVHFILIDGTWNNSKAMISRLKERARSVWDGHSFPCVGLSPENVSPMHNLRPQPSLERTCTAGAASQLLRELSWKTELSGLKLGQAADVLDASLAVLQDALVTRRRRVGRTTQRFGRSRFEISDVLDSNGPEN